MSRTAILWPAGIVTSARTFSFVTSVPVAISTRAITTSSSGCRRMVRSAAWSMASSWEVVPRQPENDLRDVGADDQRYEQRHQPGQDRDRRALERQFSHA